MKTQSKITDSLPGDNGNLTTQLTIFQYLTPFSDFPVTQYNLIINFRNPGYGTSKKKDNRWGYQSGPGCRSLTANGFGLCICWGKFSIKDYHSIQHKCFNNGTSTLIAKPLYQLPVLPFCVLAECLLVVFVPVFQWRHSRYFPEHFTKCFCV